MELFGVIDALGLCGLSNAGFQESLLYLLSLDLWIIHIQEIEEVLIIFGLKGFLGGNLHSRIEGEDVLNRMLQSALACECPIGGKVSIPWWKIHCIPPEFLVNFFSDFGMLDSLCREIFPTMAAGSEKGPPLSIFRTLRTG